MPAVNRVQNWRYMQMLISRNDGRVDFGTVEQLAIVSRYKVCIEFFGDNFCALGVLLSNTDPANLRMPGRHFPTK